MPAAAAVAIGTIAAGAIASSANNSASKRQANTAGAALDFSKQQEAERKREWDAQQTAAAAQWKAKQDMLRPFNAAAYSVLGKYGIPVSMPSETAPSAGQMPADWQPGQPLPGAGSVPMPSPSAPQPGSAPQVPYPTMPSVPPPVGSSMAPATGGVQPASTMGQMMGAFDWQSPFAKPGSSNA